MCSELTWLCWLSVVLKLLYSCGVFGNTSVISDRSTAGSNPVWVNDAFLAIVNKVQSTTATTTISIALYIQQTDI